MKDRAFYSKIGKKGIKLRWGRIHSKIRIPERMNKEKASLHAYLCGDGNINIRNEKSNSTIHYEVRFFPDDSLMLNNICNCIKKLYNFEPNPPKRKGKMYCLRVNNKIICKDLIKLGKYGKYDWNVPKEIKNNFKEIWLSCFFDCEAHVDKKGAIYVKSVNSSGLKIAKEMLANLGIYSNFYGPYTQKIGSSYFVLSINKREDLIQYAKKVGFNHSEKVKKLYSILNLRPDGPTVRRK